METKDWITIGLLVLTAAKLLLTILKKQKLADILDSIIDAVEKAPMSPATRMQLKQDIKYKATGKLVNGELDQLVQKKFPKDQASVTSG